MSAVRGAMKGIYNPPLLLLLLSLVSSSDL